jgi:hypothetical protein
VFASVVGTPHDPKAWHDREYRHARKAAGLPETLRLRDPRHSRGISRACDRVKPRSQPFSS